MLLLLICSDIESQTGPNNESISRSDFQQFLCCKGIKVAHQNIRGIISNFDILQEFLLSHKNIDVLTISETHLSDDTHNSSLKIEGFNFVHRYRKSGKGGGVGLYIKNTLN